tara:strand:+ start:388 stop:627 length:240 start_codon:yes stop_codon:yes gene_type:complete
MKTPTFIRVTKAEEDEDSSPPFYAVEKLIRVSDIRDIDELEFEDESGFQFEGSLVNFYDGDSMIVVDNLDELHEKLEGK